jgi:transposase
MRAKEVANDMRKKIIAYHEKKIGLTKIHEKTNVAISTIKKIIEKWKKSGVIVNLPRSGRKKCTTTRQDRLIIQHMERNPRLSVPKLEAELKTNYQLEVSKTTIRKRLNKAGYHGRRPSKKPWLSTRNVRRRLEWARAHVNWTVDQWKTVLWSDETKVNLFGSDGINKIWRKRGERLRKKNLLPTVKHGGGSIMVWGCFNWKGVGNIHVIPGIMTKEVYLDLLENNLMSSKRKLRLQNNFIFQQDGDPKHTAKIVSEWFTKNRIKKLDWPAQSPDMNPIEHLWTIIKRKVRERAPTNKTELEKVLREEWELLDKDTMKKLVESMPQRVAEVIKARGGHTHY